MPACARARRGRSRTAGKVDLERPPPYRGTQTTGSSVATVASVAPAKRGVHGTYHVPSDRRRSRRRLIRAMLEFCLDGSLVAYARAVGRPLDETRRKKVSR